jgi:hypothetical protein
MFIKKLLNSTNLYALANTFFAAANAISSILIVKFFGLRVYGYISYFNSIDTFIDYFGGFSRSTFEYASASSQNQFKVINSFAMLQLFLGLVSVVVFSFLTLCQQDSIAIKVCQTFIFLSPGKSYLNFFRILSKVTGSLKWFTVVVILLSVLNIISVFISDLYFDFFIYLILRAALLVLSAIILFFIYPLSLKTIGDKLIYSLNELRFKSRTVFFYSFIGLFTVVFDKLLIKHFFGVEVLGVFSLAFLAHNMFLIFGGSIIGGSFKVLTNCLPQDYVKVLNNAILWVILLMICVEVLILVFLNEPVFRVYKDSIVFMIWFFPAAILAIFVQLSYVFLIAKEYLGSFNRSFFYVSAVYLIMAISLSIYYDDSIWFAIVFLLHQAIMVILLALKFRFLANIFKVSIIHSKIIIFSFILTHMLFKYLL